VRFLKYLLIVVLGFGAFGAVVAGLVFFFTSGMTDSAGVFLTAVKEKRDDQAYRSLSEEFRASTSLPEFVAFLDESALRGFKEVSWSSLSIKNSNGKLKGVVTTESGGSVPLELSMLKENGQWRIHSLRKQAAGLAAGSEPSD
jgi:hypothetical protein